METTITLQQAAKDALARQNTCNLSGVVPSFLQAVQAVNAEARRLGEGTKWQNNHAIIRLYVGKLASLCRMQGDAGFENYAIADLVCRQIASEGEAGS